MDYDEARRKLVENLELALKRGSLADTAAFTTVITFLIDDIGIEYRLLKPLTDLCLKHTDDKFRGPYGGRARPATKAMALAKQAALYTVCRERKIKVGKTPAAVQKFQNQLTRKRATARDRKFYEMFLEEYRGEPLTDFFIEEFRRAPR